jgi:hypothetical protein
MDNTAINDAARFPAGGESRLATAALWASAFVIMALIIVQAGRLGGPVMPAHADIATVGDITIATTQGSSDEEILVVMNRVDQALLLYSVDGSRRLQLLQHYSLPQVFDDMAGRRGSGGNTPR